jgi:predicted nucleic acid-binding protein
VALDLPTGTRCFVDANILYYHFVETPPLSDPSTVFLKRVINGELTAFTSASVLAEAIHKIMLAEAAARFQLQRPNLVNWLANHRDHISHLVAFRAAAEELAIWPLVLLPVDGALLSQAALVSQQHRLLTNDAQIVALMRVHGLADLVTNDDDFDAVSNMTIWKPR